MAEEFKKTKPLDGNDINKIDMWTVPPEQKRYYVIKEKDMEKAVKAIHKEFIG